MMMIIGESLMIRQRARVPAGFTASPRRVRHRNFRPCKLLVYFLSFHKFWAYGSLRIIGLHFGPYTLCLSLEAGNIRS